MEYFAQDEATRLDPALTVYETLASGSPNNMVPAIRNILGGFLFSGDDVYKKAGVLSGGERTRLAVARMLLRPSNTLLMDEPTNHLDLDSKDVLLDALEDYGGTLILVSHDRYFVEKLANKIIEIGHGQAVVYPGTYPEFLWSKAQAANPKAQNPNTKSQPKPEGGKKPEVRRADLQVRPRRPRATNASRLKPTGRRSSASSTRCRSGSPTSRAGSRRARRRSGPLKRLSPRRASTRNSLPPSVPSTGTRN
jgi:ATP-binding cassette subfamily F protein 3